MLKYLIEDFLPTWDLGQKALDSCEEIYLSIVNFVAANQLNAKTLRDNSKLLQVLDSAELLLATVQFEPFREDPLTYELRIMSSKCKFETLQIYVVDLVDSF